MEESGNIRLGRPNKLNLDREETIRQIRTLYPTVPSAFKEYPSNALDATAEVKRRKIEIYLDKDGGAIVVSDNGEGFGYEDLPRIFCSISRSEHAGKLDRQGSRGWGVQAFGRFGQTAVYETREKESDKVLVVEIKDFDFIPYLYTRKGNPLAFHQFPDGHGTKAKIHGIPKDMFEKHFRPGDVKKLMQYYFAPALMRSDVSVHLGYKSGNRTMEEMLGPPDYKGDIILNKTVPVGNDNKGQLQTIQFRVHELSSVASERLALFVRDQRVRTALAEHRGVKEPWDNRYLTGFVNANFLKLNADKTELSMDDSKYELFLKELEAFGRELSEQLGTRKSRKGLYERERELMQQLMIGWDLAYSRHFALGRDGHIAEPPLEGPKTDDRKGRGKGKGGESGRRTERRPVLSYDPFVGPEKTRVRARYDPNYNQIIINTAHPDWEVHFEGGDRRTKGVYLALICSDVLAEYKVTMFLQGERVDPADARRKQALVSEDMFSKALEILR